MDLATELIKLGSVGVLSGVFGAFMALRRYKYEKWWEMRVNAYKAVIESLSDMTAIYEKRNNNWEQSPIEPKNISQELRVAREKVRKHRDMGAFLFSNDAEAALTDFVDFQIDYERVTDPGDVYGPFCQISRKCLEKIVALSKKDLAVNGRWL
ncbi:hypothetical protein [Dasania marina]|uniref:hypothetical protein n=1 Tax=Dasania marina TaxID=471499 RepID=UPI0030DDDBA1|tara:strand:+ start:35467 stop:35925 length:459 start_codon:yes stop_codon:yes gene_type:complete